MSKLVGAAAYLYMCSGAVLGFFALVDIGSKRFSDAFLLIFLATLIDYSDGSISRWIRVDEMFPGIDSWKLDGVIDFVNLALVPSYILWQAEILPPPPGLWVCLIILSSLYRFARRFEPDIEKGFYRGLPVLWIFPTYYAFFDILSPLLLGAVLVVMMVAGFTSAPFLHIARYPADKVRNVLPLLAWWVIFWGVTQDILPGRRLWLLLSLMYPCYYVAASFYSARKKFWVAGRVVDR